MKKNRSALKRARQSEKRRRRNVVYRSRIKTFTKKVEAYLKEGDREKTEEALKLLISTIDKACQKGVIHKNTASRKKSRITRKVNELLLKIQPVSLPEVPELKGGISSPVT